MNMDVFPLIRFFCNFFQKVWHFSEYESYISLDKFILKCYIFPDANTNGIVFLILFWNVYRYCKEMILIFSVSSPAASLNWLILTFLCVCVDVIFQIFYM